MERQMVVEIIHRACIKPASPTPCNLRTYKLSLLDQLHSKVTRVPIFFFYPFNHSTIDSNIVLERRQKLKASLSETLTHYYPFAGKLNNDFYIDCNDDGVYYIEAQVKDHCLSSFLDKPETYLFKQLVPCHPSLIGGSEEATFVLMIQVNIFQCGGIAICLNVSHKIFDGTTSFSFMKAWAATARTSETIPPNLIAQSLFPQNPSLPPDSTLFVWPNVLKQGKRISRRFGFNAVAISRLKAKVSCSSSVQFPTKFEAVLAIIWRSILLALRTRNGYERPSIICFTVDLRKRALPQLPENIVGNLIWSGFAKSKADSEIELHQLVGHLREAKEKINNQLIEEMKGRKGFFKVLQLLKGLSDTHSDVNVEYIPTTSVLNCGMYDTDFGWGKPLWVTLIDVNSDANAGVFFNFLCMMETRFGDGVEVLVTLDERDMALVERNLELLSFASIDPSPFTLDDSMIRPRL